MADTAFDVPIAANDSRKGLFRQPRGQTKSPVFNNSRALDFRVPELKDVGFLPAVSVLKAEEERDQQIDEVGDAVDHGDNDRSNDLEDHFENGDSEHDSQFLQGIEVRLFHSRHATAVWARCSLPSVKVVVTPVNAWDVGLGEMVVIALFVAVLP
ncbi:MAG: hypothetical protein Q8K78_12565, partial [Planctomycetaceae bacterium]|nr:hypothetical protein [Planctomycetaceae bacterium]